MINYRKDIDGLRGLSVVAVILFHADISFFSGGFIGVDIFFVISGFLITSILIKETKEENFSFLRFYERRIRRIFPALFFMLIPITAVSTILLLPPDLKNYGQSLAAAAVSLSNVLFWKEDGYFSTDSSLKPLLHTWSLGVEEQFYIFFPVFIWMIYFCKLQRNILLLFVTIFILSLFSSAWLTAAHPKFAFFLPVTRTWELLLGGILALNIMPAIKNDNINAALSISGLLCILSTIFLYTKETVFPCISALIPCLGAGLIIYSGTNKTTLVHKIFSTSPLVFTGLISYSLYLWHWPIFSLYRYFNFRDLTIPEISIVIASSFLIACLSWRYIEQPFRGNKSPFTQKQVFTLSFLAISVSLVTGAAFHLNAGFPQRLTPEVRSIIEARNEVTARRDTCLLHDGQEDLPLAELCLFGHSDSKQYDVALWGDSHADQLVPGLEVYANKNKFSGLRITKAGCPPLSGALRIERTGHKRHDCKNFNDKAMNFLADNENIKTVIIAARWIKYTEGENRYKSRNPVDLINEQFNGPSRDNSRRVLSSSLEKTIEALIKSGKKVILIGSVPEPGYRVPDCLARGKSVLFSHINCELPTRISVDDDNAYIQKVFLEIKNKHPQLKIVFPADIMCDSKSCLIAQDYTPFYRDEDHLSYKGSEYLVDRMALKGAISRMP